MLVRNLIPNHFLNYRGQKRKKTKERIGARQYGVYIKSTTINGGKRTNKKIKLKQNSSKQKRVAFFRVCAHACISADVLCRFLCKRHRKNSLFLNTTNTIVATGK